MAILSDSTVTGAGDIPGFFSPPLSVLTDVVDPGMSRTHDIPPAGRLFDIGWWAPYFIFDLGTGAQNYALEAHFVAYDHAYTSLHDIAPGGIDGLHYNCGNGVTLRIVITDD